MWQIRLDTTADHVGFLFLHRLYLISATPLSVPVFQRYTFSIVPFSPFQLVAGTLTLKNPKVSRKNAYVCIILTSLKVSLITTFFYYYCYCRYLHRTCLFDGMKSAFKETRVQSNELYLWAIKAFKLPLLAAFSFFPCIKIVNFKASECFSRTGIIRKKSHLQRLSVKWLTRLTWQKSVLSVQMFFCASSILLAS